MNLSKELIGASTQLLVLSVLARDASYGYEIIRRINAESGGIFTWQEGTVYPILHKLELDEKVRAQWQEADTGRRRKYYYITAKGRKALEAGTKEWSSLHGLLTRMAGASYE
ncbi:MAG TPA: helix-turn-helix transcriptional regulator [Candidatus Hydrogenedentes bacterium]|nr:helix-turn-helix transcriptional regulator [Candidatus Hydrogenedentota bacterium]